MKKHLAIAAAGLLLLAIGGFLLRSKGPEDPPTEPLAAPTARPAATAVGSQACAECHEAPTATWRASHHGRAMALPAGDSVLGDFSGVQAEDTGERALFRKDGEDYVALIDDQPLRVAYAFGVQPLQQYLVEQEDGRLQALGWAWDTRPAESGGQRWFHLSPGEEPGSPLHWTGYLYTANRMCVECHVSGFDLAYDGRADRFATSWTELGVGCESCHGPGSAHVAWAKAGAQPTEDRGLGALFSAEGSWVRADGQATAHWSGPAKDPARMERCWTCHALRTVFEPALSTEGPLLDRGFPRLLDPDAYHPDGQISAEVFVYGSFTQSKMFRAGVDCADCHEPHGLGMLAEGNALCARCHSPQVFDAPTHHHHAAESEGARCVSCHMPGKVYMKNDLRRDHRLAVPRPDLRAELETPDACAGCHQDQAADWAAEQAKAWWPKLGERPSFAHALVASRRGQADAEAKLNALATDESAPAIARATALTELPSVATSASRETVARLLVDPEPLVRAAALRALEAFPPQARWVLGADLLSDPLRAVRQEAARLLAAPEPPPTEHRAAFTAALAELEASERANGCRPDGLVNLGNLYLRLGRPEEAEKELRAALKADPTSHTARLNLADVLRTLGRDAEGEALLREARRLAPDSGMVAHALGLRLIRKGEKPAALEELREAAALSPETSRFAYVLAVALADQGQPLEAAAVLQEAYARRPADLQLLWALVETLRDMGDPKAAAQRAAELVERVPGNPRAKQLLESLRSR